MSSREYVYKRFCDFYRTSKNILPPPSAFNQREFGFLLFKERVMVRHKSFANHQALLSFAKDRIPSDVYYSSAYYENPAASMEKKGWQGADLVFDIDADHIPTSCNKIHDAWTCANAECGFSGKGITPEACPLCGGVKFEVKTWACELCIDTTRDETRKLLDMLQNDFGFAEHELHTFFSGHRGYHIHVESEAVKGLDAMARKEIVDYVSGIGLSLPGKGKRGGKGKRKPAPAKGFVLSDYGWNRRLKLGMRRFLQTASKEALVELGLKRNAEAILNNKDAILKLCVEKNLWDSIKGVSVESWSKLLEYIKTQEAPQIDTVVTSDIHRLIRATGTLHGKTGMLKVEFPINELDSFDPFVGAVAFKEGTAKVWVWDAPQFSLMGQTFGPFKNQGVELPTAAAVLLICKGRAKVQE
ncbi:MAG: DNA primase small subunit PriS [Candidatus Bathyarchaeota archaeon]|nr:DNA primase small subunit PriS [Candidatus Bathyarchaeota archaeon]